jgi:hypothetical protein
MMASDQLPISTTHERRSIGLPWDLVAARIAGGGGGAYYIKSSIFFVERV